MANITVFRYGHRPDRDKRITTHVALVARALGAKEIVIGTKSTEIEDTVIDVVHRFGGEFKIRTGMQWRKFFRKWNGIIVHLTMYGIELDTVIHKIEKAMDILVIVGSKKVPGDFYHVSDFNVAIGHQPHSEVAALAIFLDRLTQRL
jgi:tRNA (cytidine56-2'-O)-methyltransferase